MTTRLQDWLTRQAERRPDACAVVFGQQRLTYGELDVASNRFARALKGAGCRRGDRVALLLPKSIEAIVAMFAALKADCIYVPLDPSSPSARLVHVLELCESRCILAMDSTAALLADIIEHGGLADSTQVGWMDENYSGREVRGCFSWRDVLLLADSPVASLNDDSHVRLDGPVERRCHHSLQCDPFH